MSLATDALSCNENRLVEELIIVHGKGTCRAATIRGRRGGAKRRATRSRPVVRIGRPDASLTGLAGLVCVDELVGRLGIVGELDRGIGPVKARNRGHTAGLLAGQDCLTGSDRVRADPGSRLLEHAPVPAATTAVGLARRFDPQRLAGIEAGLARVYARWLGLVPAAVRGPLVLRDPTIDCDATDIEVYGSKKDRVGWNYAGVKCGRVHLASWAQAELPLAADLLAGNDDVRPQAADLLRRALAVLPPQVCGRPRVRPRRRVLRPVARPRRGRPGLRLRDRGHTHQRCLAGLRRDPRRRVLRCPGHARRAGRRLRLHPRRLARGLAYSPAPSPSCCEPSSAGTPTTATEPAPRPCATGCSPSPVGSCATPAASPCDYPPATPPSPTPCEAPSTTNAGLTPHEPAHDPRTRRHRPPRRATPHARTPRVPTP